MPLDYRRINAPEDSVPYKSYTKDFVRDNEKLFKELLDSNGKRKDGRLLGEAGSMYVNTDMVSQSKGSSYVEFKNTKVICSVFDPREIPHQNEFSQLGELYCEVKFASFSCPRQRRQLVPDAEERALSVALRQALEPAVCRNRFPNYQIDVFIYILENGGACLAAAINAAGIALANAAVPMYDIITASSVAILDDKFFIDPTEEEEYIALLGTEDSNHGVVTVSSLLELKQISDFTQIGSMDAECVNKAMDILVEECEKLVPLVQNCLLKYVVEGMKENKKLEDEAKEREKILDQKVEELKKSLKAG